MDERKKWGGKRPGAGRPLALPNPNFYGDYGFRKPHSIYCTERELAIIKTFLGQLRRNDKDLKIGEVVNYTDFPNLLMLHNAAPAAAEVAAKLDAEMKK